MLRFASINIEGHTHIDRVLSFLKEYKSDVVCLQELSEIDIPNLEKELGMKCRFVPMASHYCVPEDNTSLVAKIGLGILSRELPISSKALWYWGKEGILPIFKKVEPRNLINCILFSAHIPFVDGIYTFATTHFTWTPDGGATDEQRTDLKNLLKILEGMPDFVLAGDFNAPRGGEIFGQLASRYKDNIPVKYTTSIDKDLHRAKGLELMVDGLFSTPEYEMTDVKLSSGVSDHMAITAFVRKI